MKDLDPTIAKQVIVVLHILFHGLGEIAGHSSKMYENVCSVAAIDLKYTDSVRAFYGRLGKVRSYITFSLHCIWQVEHVESSHPKSLKSMTDQGETP
jgi:hypothetical protein